MTRYMLDDGKFIETKNAIYSWMARRYFDGNNHICKATGSQWEHEKLWLSKKGTYFVEHWSQIQGCLTYAKKLSREEAAKWLLRNDYDLQGEIEGFEEVDKWRSRNNYGLLVDLKEFNDILEV